MLKKAILLLLALYLYMPARAQKSCTSSFSGQVTDADGNPMVGATIVLTPGKLGRTTDVEGRYAFHNICPGNYMIVVQYLGFKEISLKLLISGRVEQKFVLEEDVAELKEVVIQHHDETNTEHATNFVELDERKLAESAGKTLGETLKEIPGVTTLQTGPGIFKPVIHGVHSQRLLILNYGIRQEGQQWGAEHAPEIDPFIASNIVVIKDASAIKYGADALGGVIVVNPAPLPETNNIGGTFASVIQSNGRSGTLSGMIEGGIKNRDGWGWRMQGTGKRTGDFQTPGYNLTNTGVKELNFSAAAGYHAKTLGLDFFFSRFQSEIGILRGSAVGNVDDLVNALERDVPLYTTDFSYNIREPRQRVSHNLFKVNGHLQGASGEWRFQYGFQNNARQEFDFRIGDLSKIPAIDLLLNTHTIDVEWETHHSKSRTFSFGVNLMQQANKNVPGTYRIPFIPNFNSYSGGAFAISKFYFSKWTIDAGARFDYRTYSVKGFDFKNSRYNSSFDFGNASMALGVIHQINASQSINLNVSTSWRPPHVSELYSIGTHQSAASIEYGLLLDHETNEVLDIDDVNFSPEQAVKVVTSYQLKKENLRLEFTPYANYIFNYIYLRPFGITQTVRGVYPYYRYAQTDALFLGLDIDVTAKIHKNLTAHGRASLLKARDVSNESYFLFIPPSRYGINLRYDRPGLFFLRNVYVEAGLQYVSRQFFAPRVISVREIIEAEENGTDPFNGDPSIFDFAEPPQGYALANVAAGFSIKSKNVQYDFRLSCDNLLNQKYRDYTNRFRYYADDLGRNGVLSIKCIF